MWKTKAKLILLQILSISSPDSKILYLQVQNLERKYILSINIIFQSNNLDITLTVKVYMTTFKEVHYVEKKVISKMLQDVEIMNFVNDSCFNSDESPFP